MTEPARPPTRRAAPRHTAPSYVVPSNGYSVAPPPGRSAWAGGEAGGCVGERAATIESRADDTARPCPGHILFSYL